jgi:hypothetical protein
VRGRSGVVPVCGGKRERGLRVAGSKDRGRWARKPACAVCGVHARRRGWTPLFAVPLSSPAVRRGVGVCDEERVVRANSHKLHPGPVSRMCASRPVAPACDSPGRSGLGPWRWRRRRLCVVCLTVRWRRSRIAARAVPGRLAGGTAGGCSCSLYISSRTGRSRCTGHGVAQVEN